MALTLRGLDDTTTARLKAEAARRGISVNALLRSMVDEGLGLRRAERRRRYSDLDALAGTWSAADAKRFADATAAFERIDPEMWR